MHGPNPQSKRKLKGWKFIVLFLGLEHNTPSFSHHWVFMLYTYNYAARMEPIWSSPSEWRAERIEHRLHIKKALMFCDPRNHQLWKTWGIKPCTIRTNSSVRGSKLIARAITHRARLSLSLSAQPINHAHTRDTKLPRPHNGHKIGH